MGVLGWVAPRDVDVGGGFSPGPLTLLGPKKFSASVSWSER